MEERREKDQDIALCQVAAPSTSYCGVDGFTGPNDDVPDAVVQFHVQQQGPNDVWVFHQNDGGSGVDHDQWVQGHVGGGIGFAQKKKEWLHLDQKSYQA